MAANMYRVGGREHVLYRFNRLRFLFQTEASSFALSFLFIFWKSLSGVCCACDWRMRMMMVTV